LHPGTWIIINTLGGVALLLWGVRMVRTGVMRAWGDRLKRFIEANLANRVMAFLSGAAATVLLQSGTGAALIVTGLSASGVVGAATGLSVLLGADLGSALVTALVAGAGPAVTIVSPILLFAGFVTFSATSSFRPRNAGRILMGLGAMLLALRLIAEASQPLREASLFHSVLDTLGSEPLLALLTGALVTWLSHSSLATIMLIASLQVSGALEAGAALAFVLGVNLGGGLPALVASAGQPRKARRLPLANLACRAALALALVPALAPIGAELAARIAEPVWQTVSFHAAFNMALVVLCLPFAPLIMKGVARLWPDVADTPDTLERPRYLDRASLDVPAAALVNAQTETVRMTEILDRMFQISADAIQTHDMSNLKTIRSLDERLNTYHSAIHTYLAALSESDLEAEEERRVHDVMMFISNLEHAGDIIHLSLVQRIKSKAKRSIAFNQQQGAAIAHLTATVQSSLKMASGVLLSGDVDAALRLVDQKDAFRSFENSIIEEHFRDPKAASHDTAKSGALYVDLIRDLHQINSHIVSAAYPVVEAAGLLRETRLRKRKGR
jgi:phosphate:Na+ symporter